MESTARSIVRHKLLHGPDSILPSGRTEDLKKLEALTAALMAHLDIEEAEEDLLLLQAADLMTQLGAGERHRNLLLTLMQGALLDAKRIEEIRASIRTELEVELAEIREEYKDELKPPQIRVLLDEARAEADRRISQPSTVILSELPSRTATPFEAAYIREEIKRSRRQKDALKAGLMAALRISEGSVNSSVAHAKIGKGGKTVQELLDLLRRPTKKESPDIHETVVTGNPYEFLTDATDASFLENLRANSERQWIFGISLLTPEEHRTEARAPAAAQLGKTPQQLHAQAAYLTGTLWETARAAQSRIFQDAMVIYEYRDNKKAAISEAAPKATAESATEPVTSTTVEARGDTFDYDNPIKRAWRATWFKYLV